MQVQGLVALLVHSRLVPVRGVPRASDARPRGYCELVEQRVVCQSGMP
jgi:hypothetical protein